VYTIYHTKHTTSLTSKGRMSENSSATSANNQPKYQTTHKTLRQEVNAILKSCKTDATRDSIRDAHAEFVKQYPKFFEKLMDPAVDETQMNYIIGMYEKVQQQKRTFDGASKEIGQKMFDQYVKPGLPPPSDKPPGGIQFGDSK